MLPKCAVQKCPKGSPVAVLKFCVTLNAALKSHWPYAGHMLFLAPIAAVQSRVFAQFGGQTYRGVLLIHPSRASQALLVVRILVSGNAKKNGYKIVVTLAIAYDAVN